MIVEIINFINDLPDAIRMLPPVMDVIEATVGLLDAITPDADIDFIFFEDGSVEIVD